MPILPNFPNDVFVSYAHADNETGWINQFRARLLSRLGELGVRAEVWKDGKLKGSDDFSDEILAQLSKSALLISVVTPHSCGSHWCERERERFEQFAAASGGFRMGNRYRAVKVVKTPLDDRADRKIFPATLGYEFFRIEEETGVLREFIPGTPEFEYKLDEIAQNVKSILAEMRASAQFTRATAPLERVYLAEVAKGLSERRSSLRDQLCDWGYVVFPEAPLNPDDSYVDQVQSALKDCRLSIHLFNEERGTIPGDEQYSIPVLQYRAALARKLDRIVWIPSGTTLYSSVAEALNDKEQSPFERLEGTEFESLKDIVGQKMRRQLDESVLAGDDSDERIVYLVCDRSDHPYVKTAQDSQLTKQLKEYIESQGYSVWLPPVSEMSKPKLVADFRQSLQLSHGVVFFWGSASEQWFRETYGYFLSAKQRKGRRLRAQAICLGEPRVDPKLPYVGKKPPPLCIEEFDGFKSGPLMPFLQQMRG